MPSGPRKVALPLESAHNLCGLRRRAPQEIPSISAGDLQMTCFDVLDRTPCNHLARPQDHGTQITEIRCPRNSTPSLLKRRASTSATMFQSSSLPHPRRPARTDLSSGEARTPRRIYSPAANEQLPTTTLPSHLSSAEGVPGGHRSTPSARCVETASGMVTRLHAFRTRLDGHLLIPKEGCRHPQGAARLLPDRDSAKHNRTLIGCQRKPCVSLGSCRQISRGSTVGRIWPASSRFCLNRRISAAV